eukprot:9331369-Karenia_brevis.AAC.1
MPGLQYSTDIVGTESYIPKLQIIDLLHEKKRERFSSNDKKQSRQGTTLKNPTLNYAKKVHPTLMFYISKAIVVQSGDKITKARRSPQSK